MEKPLLKIVFSIITMSFFLGSCSSIQVSSGNSKELVYGILHELANDKPVVLAANQYSQERNKKVNKDNSSIHQTKKKPISDTATSKDQSILIYKYPFIQWHYPIKDLIYNTIKHSYYVLVYFPKKKQSIIYQISQNQWSHPTEVFHLLKKVNHICYDQHWFYLACQDQLLLANSDGFIDQSLLYTNPTQDKTLFHFDYIFNYKETIYAVDQRNGSIIRLDQHTFQWIPIGQLPKHVQNMTFSQKGNLYFVQKAGKLEQLKKYSLKTHKLTFLLSLPHIQALFYLDAKQELVIAENIKNSKTKQTQIGLYIPNQTKSQVKKINQVYSTKENITHIFPSSSPENILLQIQTKILKIIALSKSNSMNQ